MIRVRGSTTDGFWGEVVKKCTMKYSSYQYIVNNYFLYLFDFFFLFQVSKVVQENSFNY